MKLSTQVSSSYTRPVIESAILSALVLIVSYRIQDRGEAGIISAYAVVCFWAGILMIVLRRPHSPTRADLEVIRFGALVIVPATQLFIRLLWHSAGLAF